MKICFLAPANNYHTKKWCEYFTSKGYQVDVISFVSGNIDNVNVHHIITGANVTDSDIKKIKYLFKVRKIKKLIKELKPDIINAHFATSYGMIASLCKIKFFLSVWGNDVYTFPKKSIIHKLYFKFILKKATYIFSTSNIMAQEISKFTNKQIYVTPFGVKMNLFKPNNKKHEYFVVGTIKSIKEKYGIDYIIKAAKIVTKERKDIDLKVKIAGSGDKEQEYKQLAKNLNINIDWLGFISQEQAAKEWALMDIALIPSIDDSESFGVSVVEAQACGIPVIISDSKGLLETTDEASRIVIPKKNERALANAIIELYDNREKRKEMGIIGRKYVEKKYDYNTCFKEIEKLFKKLK